MSVRVTSLVWDSNVSAPERFTLLALADRADEDGKCWPSIPTLALKCRTSESTIRRHLKSLTQLGALTVEHRKNTSSMYRISLPRLRQLVDPAQIDTPQSDTPQIDTPQIDGSTCQIDQSRPVNLHIQTPQSDTQYIIDSPVDTSVIRQGARERAPKPRATRIPEDFTVTPAMVAWAHENAPHVDGRRETENFVDYWRASATANARKLDWIAAWRTWMRKADSSPAAPALRSVNGGRTGASRVPTTTQRVNDALALLRPGED